MTDIMILPTPDTDVLMATENEVLIGIRAQLQKQIEELTDARDRIDYALTKHMEADDATAISHPDYNVALEPPAPKYDPGVLRRVFEYVQVTDLTDAGAYTSEHLETVPDKWNMTKLKPFAKYHGNINGIIEDAKIEAPAIIKVKRKKGK